MNQSTDGAVASVLREKECHVIPRDLHEHRKIRLEPVLPVDLETEPIDVESFALGIALIRSVGITRCIDDTPPSPTVALKLEKQMLFCQIAVRGRNPTHSWSQSPRSIQ